MISGIVLPEPEALLPGERMVLANLSMFQLFDQGSSQEVAGILMATNYQLIFKIPNFKHVITIPVSTILEITRNMDRDGLFTVIIQTKDFRTIKFATMNDVCRKLLEYVDEYGHHGQYQKLFAFQYKAGLRGPGFNVDGWTLFDLTKDLKRMGVLDNSYWRISNANANYQLCPTYSKVVAVPASISDAQLKDVAAYRSGGRIPILSYLHQNGCALTRAAQPKLGQLAAGSRADAELVKTSRGAPSNMLTILETRVRINSYMVRAPIGGANQSPLMASALFDGSAYADMNVNFQYLGLDNINVLHQCYNKLQQLILNSDSQSAATSWLSALDATGWLQQQAALLKAGQQIASLLDEGSSVMVQCLDGWDRTSQLVSLAAILCDPHARTLDGFEALLYRDWMAAGHRFHDRLGHGKKDTAELSPVFIQFLDAVWQILQQHPSSFEFNENFLSFIFDHVYSCLYGTFLANSEKEREEWNVAAQTASIWSQVAARPSLFRNYQYAPASTARSSILRVDSDILSLRFWTAQYLPSDADDILSAQDAQHQLAQKLDLLEHQKKELKSFIEKIEADLDDAAEDAADAAASSNNSAVAVQKLSQRNAELKERLVRVAKASPNIEANVSALLMQNEQLVADCRAKKLRIDQLRRQRGDREQSMNLVTNAEMLIALNTMKRESAEKASTMPSNFHSSNSSTSNPSPLSASSVTLSNTNSNSNSASMHVDAAQLPMYSKFYVSLLRSIKELLLYCQKLTDAAIAPTLHSERLKAVQKLKAECSESASAVVEATQISPQSRPALLQEAKSASEAVVLLLAAADDSFRTEIVDAAELQSACQFVADSIRHMMEVASAPLKGGAAPPDPKTEKKRTKVERLTAVFHNRDIAKVMQDQRAGNSPASPAPEKAKVTQATNASSQRAPLQRSLSPLSLPPPDALPPPPSAPAPLPPTDSFADPQRQTSYASPQRSPRPSAMAAGSTIATSPRRGAQLSPRGKDTSGGTSNANKLAQSTPVQAPQPTPFKRAMDLARSDSPAAAAANSAPSSPALALSPPLGRRIPQQQTLQTNNNTPAANSPVNTSLFSNTAAGTSGSIATELARSQSPQVPLLLPRQPTNPNIEPQRSPRGEPQKSPRGALALALAKSSPQPLNEISSSLPSSMLSSPGILSGATATAAAGGGGGGSKIVPSSSKNNVENSSSTPQAESAMSIEAATPPTALPPPQMLERMRTLTASRIQRVESPARTAKVEEPNIAPLLPPAVAAPPLPEEGSLPHFNPQEIIKWGYLLKRGEKRAAWQKRWFVLRFSSLSYYTSQKDAVPRATIAFEPSDTINPTPSTRPHSFVLQTKSRAWGFGAKDENEMADWMAKIRQRISTMK